ncbi:hypothetical protein NL108_008965 [Boleophthalmus pectinirostris]|nr:hypothetical protein NL108_008965 [Boleophthalmus pectinirostris]
MFWVDGGNRSTRRKPIQTRGETCKLHTESPRRPGDRTQNLLAVRHEALVPLLNFIILQQLGQESEYTRRFAKKKTEVQVQAPVNQRRVIHSVLAAIPKI